MLLITNFIDVSCVDQIYPEVDVISFAIKERRLEFPFCLVLDEEGTQGC